MYRQSKIDDVGPLTAFAGDRPELDEVSKRLLAAAQIIRERGWCQNDIEANDGRVCAIGAMIITRYGRITFGSYAVVTASEDAKRLYSIIGTDCAPSWNDYGGRTAEEVIAALESAALIPTKSGHHEVER